MMLHAHNAHTCIPCAWSIGEMMYDEFVLSFCSRLAGSSAQIVHLPWKQESRVLSPVLTKYFSFTSTRRGMGGEWLRLGRGESMTDFLKAPCG
jgi:hypothetical protein